MALATVGQAVNCGPMGKHVLHGWMSLPDKDRDDDDFKFRDLDVQAGE